jgi:hypothetical protein
MKYEQVTDYKESITGSIPIVEEIDVREDKDITTVRKMPCICGATKNLKTVMTPNGIMTLCRECRKPVIIDITARSIITQIGDELGVSPLKTLDVLDLIGEIVESHPIVRVCQKSTALEHKMTRSKTVDIYKHFNLKLSKSNPTVTLI